MSRPKIFFLSAAAMTAFAANSLLCRFALNHTGMDANLFTSLRILSGALLLWPVARSRREAVRGTGDWISALALFGYAAGFSFAYISLPAGTGALLLFGAVQVTMILHGFWKGERLTVLQWSGFLCASAGLVALLLPGISTPPLGAALLMAGAGFCWGVYSIRGKGTADPVGVTAGNFLRAAPLALLLFGVTYSESPPDLSGVAYAILSGAVTSGLGYVVWYAAVRGLTASSAATVQLSVPVLAAAGGMIFLQESLTLQYLLASAAVLGGISSVIVPNLKRV